MLTLAEEAVEQLRNASFLHTVATLQARTHSIDQAHANLMQSVRKGNNRLGGPHEWLTLALIAQELGLSASSRDAYKRIEKPRHESDVSTYELYKRLRP